LSRIVGNAGERVASEDEAKITNSKWVGPNEPS